MTEINTTITVQGNRDGIITPINLSLVVKPRPNAPLLDFTITCDVPFFKQDRLDWKDHPLMYCEHLEHGRTVGNIIDDTPVARVILDELQKPTETLYTTTECSHKGRLIRALCLFWS